MKNVIKFLSWTPIIGVVIYPIFGISNDITNQDNVTYNAVYHMIAACVLIMSILIMM